MYNLGMQRNSKNTSWQKVAPWYNRITGEKGHYYHEHLVIPGVIRLLNLKPGDKLLDAACGNGILGRSIPKGTEYFGFDLSDSLIANAKKLDRNFNHKYMVLDATKELNLETKYTHSAIVLALQNIKSPEKAINNISKNLDKNGVLVIVLNHPAFRIPRQSSWQIDESKKTQYRRVDRYMSSMEIPINTNPGDKNSPITWTYHNPLSFYTKILKDSGFVIEDIEEWVSDKESFGRASRMENRGRNEFPLFMTIKAFKI